jgi:mannitol/fructose-specific phosphotransferase system IIA component (Ntr-type)
MKISALLTPQVIKVPLESEDKDELFIELVQLLVSAGVLPAARRAEAEQLLEEREQKMSTGVGGGLALPHARLSGLEKPLIALGIAPDGLEYEALDGQPVNVVLAIFTPESDPEAHVQLLTEISRLFLVPEMVSRLSTCKAANDVLELIKSEE